MAAKPIAILRIMMLTPTPSTPAFVNQTQRSYRGCNGAAQSRGESQKPVGARRSGVSRPPLPIGLDSQRIARPQPSRFGASREPVESEGIANSEYVGWRVPVEPEPNMKIDLLVVGDSVAAAGIEQVTGAAMDRIVADILNKQERVFGDFLLDDKS
jgi:hypothetical protein